MSAGTQQRRWVILLHDHPFQHWDLLLEGTTAAESWRLMRPAISGEPVAASRLADHRLHYLTWEGPVSGDRGTVQAIHRGHFRQTDESGLPEWLLQFDESRRPPAKSCVLRTLAISDHVEFSAACLITTPDQREFWYFRKGRVSD